MGKIFLYISIVIFIIGIIGDFITKKMEKAKIKSQEEENERKE